MELRRFVSLICCAWFVISCAPTLAGNDIYFVTYNQHIEKGEFELMVMTDFTWPKERTDKVGTYMSNMLELEYGVTEQYATELMLEGFYDLTHNTGEMTGFRWENRYRLSKSKNRGLNPVLYSEYEHLSRNTRFKMEVSGREDGVGEPPELDKDERIMETRLILAQDHGPYNWAFNWINETDLRAGRRGFTDFGYAIGFRRTLSNHHHESAERTAPPGVKFCCPMHTEETSQEPATCPDCGMNMVASEETGWHGLPPGGPTRSSRWKPAAIGFEMYGGLGNSNAFGGPFSKQPQYFQPIVMFHPSKGVMVHIGAAIGLNRISDNLLRTAVGFEF